jgi:hypothetical protein
MRCLPVHPAPAAALRPPHAAQRHPSSKGQARPHTALAPVVAPGLGSVSFAPLPMAIRSSLRCEIRAVVLHLWPDEIKVHPHVRVTIPVGRRGQPVQKLRYMPLAQAQKVARKLQGTPGATVSVI